MKLVLALAAAVLIAGVAVLSASGSPPQPLDPTTATADANAVVNDASTVQGVQTTAGALASPSAAIPAGDTDTSDTGGTSMGWHAAAPNVPAGQPCWTVGFGVTGSLASQWGTWPYEQVVKEWRQWCAAYIGGPQTYRYSEMHIGEDLCSDHDHYLAKVHGGNGSTYTTVESESHFDCQTAVPWVVIHTDRIQLWKCDTYGNCIRTYKS